MPDTQQVQLPDLAFKSEIARWKGRLTPCADFWRGYESEEPALHATPLKDVSWATLFAYMHRRFGPPHLSGDDYKDLSGAWMLTTPDPQVFVRVSPCLTGPDFSLSPFYLKTAEEAAASHPMILPRDLAPERIEAMKQAYQTGLLDLLRPVGVRDHLLNALGELGESELDSMLAGDEEDEESPYIVERHDSSGSAMPVGLFGGTEWGGLCTVILGYGNGDVVSGRSKALEALRSPVFAEAASQSTAVKRLMLMADFNQRGLLLAGLQLTEDESTTLLSEIDILSRPDARESPLVSELKLEDVDLAVDLLARLGLPRQGLKERIKDLQVDQAVFVSHKELLALPAQDIPDEAIPENVYDLKVNLADFMRSRFVSQSRSDLVAWLDSTVARPHGAAALQQIAFWLHCHKPKVVTDSPEPHAKSKRSVKP